MTKKLSKILNIIKYILFMVMSIIILYGIINSYTKLEKNLIMALDLFIPFCLGLILTCINIFNKKSRINENIFFNLVAITSYIAIILIGLRANFDYNMIFFYKNPINYNLFYFNENLYLIKLICYLLLISNSLFLIIATKKNKEITEQL